MISVKPFMAVRPKRDKVHLVASRSYLSYSSTTIKEKLLNNPYTFLHVINPKFSSLLSKEFNQKKYRLVRKKLNSFIKDGVFHKDTFPFFYIYEQVTPENRYIGIIASSSVDDYLNGKIKIHEQTLESRETMFADYLTETGFNAEPVMLTYQKIPRINEIISSYTKNTSEFEFTTTDRVLHNLWIIDKATDIKEIEYLFNSLDSMYIADGHHRSASSAIFCEKMRFSCPKSNKSAPYNYFMTFLIDYEQITLKEFNRLVKDLNGLTVDEFLNQISQVYSIKILNKFKKPIKQDEICMYLDGIWYSLVANPDSFNLNDSVESLDPSILTNNILEPILDIKDVRNNNRISFLDGKQGYKALQELVDRGDYRIAFALKSISFTQLKELADQNKFMPPKSTYIEPKLRSGLTIYIVD